MVKVGATYLGDSRCQFVVWAPLLDQVAVKISSSPNQSHILQQDSDGYWQVMVENVQPGDHYLYLLNNEKERPDPASYLQPNGVHSASQIIDHQSFPWTDHRWLGVALDDMIIYELHVGTFTSEGTFAAIIPRLARLKELGITAIELMPVAQFPGNRNWGYDGVYPYAVQNSYGGPDGLKALVNACHDQEIAVILDVVYNHVGPEGNYLDDFAPYFTSKFRPEWGNAFNFDDSYCDGVRNYFLENALYWYESYHIDALRLDAIQGIYDLGIKHFLEDLVDVTYEFSQQQGRKIYLTAESDLNDVRTIRTRDAGGIGIDAQWCDDFHHSLHALVTGEQQAYYQDFGKPADLEKAFKEGFVYSGQYAPHRKRRHGSSSTEEPANKFIVFSQNHDQIGNRILGDRLTQILSFEALKLVAGTVLLSPYVPLLFMGEEYGDTAPFLYFISHSEPELIKLIQRSKAEEFRAKGFAEESYDPQDPETFHRSQLNWEMQQSGQHQILWQFYQRLIHLRRTNSTLNKLSKKGLSISSCESEQLLMIHRSSEDGQVFYIFNFSDCQVEFEASLPTNDWHKILDSSDERWSGLGAILPDTLAPFQPLKIQASSFALYQA
ncbi:malto-oligosyltrehalose trehalohydrolase [Pantanalinema sp. GBBB05]|uniref:malto-oligosyltrehalose trehalohydrolase n=1 Tax=Pantanalinema sp. GBBB05 TaxID=2604139 RepID=UPI001DF9C4B1|nr:malto-oligosyltrehalose trehalohydrolase [Pantanalinema sp. GBBB05]